MVEHRDTFCKCGELEDLPHECPTDYINIRWHWEDVKMCAEDNEIEITENQAREILQALKHGHDATLGVNWDVILWVIEGYLEGVKGDVS